MSDASLPPAELAAHATFVRRLAGHLLRDDASADDAAQSALVRALERPPRAGPGLHAWFEAVVRNVVRMGHRSGVRRAERERRAAAGECVVSADDAAARAQILRVVAEAVGSLEAAHRQVVMLRHYEGLPPREIAARLSIPVETVKSRLQRAHAELRRRLDERRGGNVEEWRASLAAIVGWPHARPEIGTIVGGAAMATGTKVAAAAAVLMIGGAAWLATSGGFPRSTGPVEGSPTAPPAAGTGPGAPSAPGQLARAPVRSDASRTPAAVPPGAGAPAPAVAAAGALVGEVRFAPDDAPVVGASVRAFQALTYAPVGAEATTTNDGGFRIAGVPVGADLELCVRAPGGATVRANVRCADALTRRVVHVPLGGILEGTVTDEDGRALVGIQVSVLPQDGQLPWRPGRGASAWAKQGERDAAQIDRATTDDRGHYALSNLPLNDERVAIAEVGARRIATGPAFEFHAVGERMRRDLRVARPGSLRVVVTGVEPAAPVEVSLGTDRLSVVLEPKDRQPDGSWLARDLSPGRWRVGTFLEGHPFLRRDVEIESAATREVELSVRGSLRVEGTLLDSDGTPVAQAPVWWRGHPPSFVRTDEAGRFRFDGLDAALGTLVANAPDPGAGRAIVEGVRPGGEPLKVSIPEPATLRVRLEGPGSEGPLLVRVATRLFTAIGPVREREEDGTWTFTVPSLGVPVQLVLQSGSSASTVLETGPLAAGEARDLGTARLGPGRDVELLVTDANGHPWPAATVTVQEADSSTQTLVTDVSGRVRVEHQPATPMLATAEIVGHPPHLFTLPAIGTGPFPLVVTDGGRLEVRILEADGSPAAGVAVVLLPPEVDPFDPDGDFAIVRLRTDATGLVATQTQARTFRVRVEPGVDYGEPHEQRVVVPLGRTASITVRLP